MKRILLHLAKHEISRRVCRLYANGHLDTHALMILSIEFEL